MARRRYIVNVDADIREEFINKILNSFTPHTVKIDIKGDNVVITLYGTIDEIKRCWYEIKDILATLKARAKAKSMGYTILELKDVFKQVGGTFPPDVIVEIGKIKGFKVNFENGKIITNISEDELLEYIVKIVKAYEDMKFQVKGKAAKKLIASLAALFDLGTDSIIESCVEEGVIEELEGNYVLAEEWRKALRRMYKVLKGSIE